MSTDDISGSLDPESKLRARAVAQLRERRDFYIHLTIYLAVNAMLIVVWIWNDPREFFWPVFPLVGWGIGIAVHAFTVFRGDQFSEDRIRRQMDRLRGTS